MFIVILSLWFVSGFASMAFWSYKANKKWGVTLSSHILSHLGFFVISGLLGPAMAFAGYVGYQISKME
jgi:hypothetical protein